MTNLTEINLSNNKLTNCGFLRHVSDSLRKLDLRSNDFPPRDLTIFSKFINLVYLRLDNNLFEGSLEPLEDLTELSTLGINDTNIDSGLEYLTCFNLCEFYCYPTRGDETRNRVSSLVVELTTSYSSHARADKLDDENLNFLTDFLCYRIKKTNEELALEREVNQESSEAMDRFYRGQFPYNSSLEQVRNEMSKQILELNLENRQLKKENEKLQKRLEAMEQISQIEQPPITYEQHQQKRL